MSMERYKQVITIDHHIDGIFSLPCVVNCYKMTNGSHYFLVKCMNADFADIGDKLCEDYDGCWWVEHKAK